MPEQNNDKESKILENEERITSMLAEIVQINKDSAAASAAEWAEIWKLSRKNEATIAELATLSKDLRKEVGGHTNKLGSYTESLAEPSIRRILEEHFDADYQGRINIEHNRQSLGPLEVDAWGVARNGVEAVYLVEVKSRFRPRHIRQIWRQVELFRQYMTMYCDHSVYPMLAVVEVSKAHRCQIWEQGIHVIDVADGVFSLSSPPKKFEANGDHGLKVHRRSLPPMRLVWDAEVG